MDRLPPHPSSSCATSEVDPRLGFAYDLRGDGRTALKVSASRYGQGDATDWAEELNPALSNRTQTRSWNDQNHDGYP